MNQAELTPGATQDVVVHAADTTTIRGGAGTLGASLDGAGVGAGLDLVLLDKETRAYVGRGAVVDAAGSITVEALSTDSVRSVVANLGIGNSVGVAGSASIQVVDTTTQAYVEDTLGGGANADVAAGGMSRSPPTGPSRRS